MTFATPPICQTTETVASPSQSHHTETIGNISQDELGIPFPQKKHTDSLGSRESPDSPSPLKRPLSPSKPLPPPPNNLGTDVLQLLVEALNHMGWLQMMPSQMTPPSQQTCIQPPNTFDRSNPDDLHLFLLKCQLTFNSSFPQQFTMDESKVFFAISHMKRTALEWFEQGIMDYDPFHMLVWHSSWKDFIIELCTNFRPANPVRSAEAELCHLCMSHEVCLMDYLVSFNTLTAHVGWGEGALCFQFYNGLPD